MVIQRTLLIIVGSVIVACHDWPERNGTSLGDIEAKNNSSVTLQIEQANGDINKYFNPEQLIQAGSIPCYEENSDKMFGNPDPLTKKLIGVSCAELNQLIQRHNASVNRKRLQRLRREYGDR